MIKTDFMNECDNCPFLEVTLNTLCAQTFERDTYFHTITCARMDECKKIIEHLRKETENYGNY